MRTLQNVLFVQTPGASLGRTGETVRVSVDGARRMSVPIHHLCGIVCLGPVMLSPALLSLCSERRIPISLFTSRGRFLARLEVPQSGFAALRRRQYRLADDPYVCVRLARAFISAKIRNQRLLLVRGARETDDPAQRHALRRASTRLSASQQTLREAETLDAVRGCEGEAARNYFAAFPHLLRRHQTEFRLTRRTRRPPRDPVNSLLSFLYTVILNEMTAALESVGLDPAVGFLHADHPARPSLALDLLEEFRPVFADRLALTLINLEQVRPDGFARHAGGAVLMDASTRQTVLEAWSRRRQEEVHHPFLSEPVPIGLLPQVQARLLVRHLRGELPEYQPFLPR